MQIEKQQEVKDWLNHPLTRNFYEATEEAINFYRGSLSELDSDFNEREIARKIGVIQGLEALLSYDPVVDEKTGEVVDI